MTVLSHHLKATIVCDWFFRHYVLEGFGVEKNKGPKWAWEKLHLILSCFHSNALPKYQVSESSYRSSSQALRLSGQRVSLDIADYGSSS